MRQSPAEGPGSLYQEDAAVATLVNKLAWPSHSEGFGAHLEELREVP